jgi:hypothetical protein
MSAGTPTSWTSVGPPTSPEYSQASPDTATLALTTGRLIIGDPATLFADAKPLPLPLPRGQHPVYWTPDRVQVRFTEQRPEYWVRCPGFSSVSGLGCLLDADALASFTDLGDEPVDEYELLVERFAVGGAGLVAFGGLTVFAAARGGFSVRVGCHSGTAVRLDCETVTNVLVQ